MGCVLKSRAAQRSSADSRAVMEVSQSVRPNAGLWKIAWSLLGERTQKEMNTNQLSSLIRSDLITQRLSVVRRYFT